VHSRDIDDAVLLKSDGFPTYHLANVVDDHLMAIDLVLRGEEWLPSLPKHVLLYRAFGWEMPLFAHVPLLLNKDRTKLSKRQNDVAASEYIAKGYLPEALLNFVALLGWNPGTTQEILSLEEMIEQFSLERIQKGGAIFDLEKLDWLQGQWMRRLSPEEFASRIRPLVTAKYPEAASDEAFGAKAALIRDRITFFSEAPEMLGYFYAEPSIAQELLVNTKQKVTADFLPSILTALIAALEGIPAEQWSEESLKTAITELTEAHGWKLGQILWPLRAAVTGRAYSPGAFEVAAAVGRGATLRRLSLAQAALGGRP
jgi:glutamyl-tRNA synthetase